MVQERRGGAFPALSERTASKGAPPGVAIAALVLALGFPVRAQNRLSSEETARVDVAVGSAFAFLYALPRDTAGARMGAWVLDTGPALSEAEREAGRVEGRWRILVTKLTDTGQDLPLADLLRDGGTSPAQLAASMAAVQRLEGKISKAEAEAALEVIVTVNEPEIAVTGVSDNAQRSKPPIAGAQLATRIHGDWIRLDDRELEIDYERWSPATLVVGFGAYGPLEGKRVVGKESLATFVVRARPTPGASGIQRVGVTAQGNEEMIDRLLRETRWEALAALVRR